MPIQSINPATGQLRKRFRPTSRREVGQALQNAERAFRKWRLVPLAARAGYLQRLAAVLRAGKRRYARMMTIEMGKPITQAEAEVEKSAWAVEHYAANASRYLAPETVETELPKSYVRFDPLGVVFAIMPWNFPFWQVLRFAAPALVAGNVGILKHASNVPESALFIEEAFRRAGFPKGVFRTILVEPPAVAAIIADDRVAAVTLTGSELAGRRVAEIAGRELKKIVLELGGSDPFIVLKDADIVKAAAVAAQARTLNSGQSCVAAKRFIVERPVARDFTRRFVEGMSRLKVGDPLDPATQIGPLARQDLSEMLDRQVRASVKKGARVLLGGKPIKGQGYYFQPTVLDRVRPGMPAFDEELFGPVAAVIMARDARDAAALANRSRYGLGAMLWTQSRRGEAMAELIESGLVFINEYLRSDPRLPFGGVKKSGYGRELGSYGIKEFVNIKTVAGR